MGVSAVLDCSTRLWLAGVCDHNGRLQLAPVAQEGGGTLFSWARIVVEPQRYAHPDVALLQRLGNVAAGREDVAGLGCRRDDGGDVRERVVVRDPFAVLSQETAGGVPLHSLCAAAIPLLVLLFRPLVEGLSRLGVPLAEVPCAVIVPGWLARAARQCCHMALRRLGLRRPWLVTRAEALGLYGVFTAGAREYLSVDSDETALCLRFYQGAVDDGRASLRFVQARQLPGAGWPGLAALAAGNPGASSDLVDAVMRRTLFGLGPEEGRQLLRDDLEAALAGPSGQALFHELGERLVPAARSLGWSGGDVGVSGLCFMAPGFERHIRDLLGVASPGDRSLAPTRPALGVAAMLAWLGREAGRRVDVGVQSGLALAVGGGIHRLVSFADLAAVGWEDRTLRRVIHLGATSGHARVPLRLRFLQGVGECLQDAVPLGAWSRDMDLSGRPFDATAAIIMRLRARGRRGVLQATARIRLGNAEEEIRLRCGVSRTVRSAPTLHD